MFIRREAYEGMKREIELLRRDAMLYKKDAEEKALHKCSPLCSGCEHLIESGQKITVVDGKAAGNRYCALDRTCKDYKKKDGDDS